MKQKSPPAFPLKRTPVRAKTAKFPKGLKKNGKERIDPPECRPEIRLKNRIIEQLSKEYEHKLQPAKRKTSKAARVLGLTSPEVANGFENPCFVESPSGVVNAAYDDSPVGVTNDGFLASPEVKPYQTEMRYTADVTPRKARVDRHRQRWVAEELQTLYEEQEQLCCCNEMLRVQSAVVETDRRVSLGEFLTGEKGKGFMHKKLLRVGSVKAKKRNDKLRRVSFVPSPIPGLWIFLSVCVSSCIIRFYGNFVCISEMIKGGVSFSKRQARFCLLCRDAR